MLAPEFVAMEIKEWVDNHPAIIDKEQKEILIELAARMFAAYEFYKREVSKT
jgi:hypothetical protein